ncbi:MAG: hypothetical protein RIE58_04705 [Vicingaceae bacterium]
MKNPIETQKFMALQERLMEERDMIGWLCTVHRNKVNYQNNPEATKKIQEQLNRASNLISTGYIFAILEEEGFNENNKWISTEDKLELKAWKHIRHTGAHAPGSRAHRYYDEFDEFMGLGKAGKSYLGKNCTFDADSINLTDGMNYRFFEFAVGLIQSAIGFCANDNPPL